MRYFKINNRWKIIFVVTLFNLLWEYSLRGINGLRAHPLLPPLLFPTYFAYFTMVEDLITRYRLRDYHVVLVAFLYGIAFQLLVPSGGAFVLPLLLGINWGVVLFVNLIWWCPIQTVMGFYVANRIVPRDWEHPLLSRVGWGLSLFTFVFLTQIFRLSARNIAQITPQGVAIMIGLMVITAFIFRRSLPSLEECCFSPAAFRKDKVMDGLSVFLVVLFFVSAVFFTRDPVVSFIHHVNSTALRAVMAGATIVVLTMLGYRLSCKKTIPV